MSRVNPGLPVGYHFSERDFLDAAPYYLRALLDQLDAIYRGRVGLTFNALQACSWAARELCEDPAHVADVRKMAQLRKTLLHSWFEPTVAVAKGHIETLRREERILAPRVDQRHGEHVASEDGARLREVRKAMRHWEAALEMAPSAVVAVAQ